MQERRAAVKAKRRQWDMPQPSKNTTGIIRFCGVPRLRGPGSDFSYHYRDFRGITETDIAPSDFAWQDSGGPLTTQSSEHNIAADSVDDVDHSPDERIAVEALALMAEGRHTARSQGSQQGSTATVPRGQQATASEAVVRALTSVAQLNEGSFTPTTPLKERSWVRRDFQFQGDYVEYKAFTYIKCWSWGVYTSTSKRRIAGNVIPGAELAAATLALPALDLVGRAKVMGSAEAVTHAPTLGIGGGGTAASDERRRINLYCGRIGGQGDSAPPTPRSTAPPTTVAPPRSITPPTVAPSTGIGVVVDIHGGSGGGSSCCSLSSLQLLLRPPGETPGETPGTPHARAGEKRGPQACTNVLVISSSTGWG
ncbi:hypothetical protein DFH08DRAFT_798351 [Mycena albidolilacea]|uniref:Uncharacterized protein n=1 Tax=Mycena albidolilacea TaxID=1033008 RepID=A0AAD7AN91_9AGAR|nr:hypothetical protein DFH08DRAFT_798351 [Mycena albidolilacea]